MEFSPPPPPPLLLSGAEIQQEQQQPHSWGLEGLSAGSVSYGSEKNGQSEEHEGEHESGQSKLCSRGHWRPVEDAKLRELVAQYGPQNWNLIAENLQGRSGKSCRLRWFNQLDPRINKKAFTEEEEERLLSAHRLYGNKWALIARFFPGRTDNAVKNHWHVIIARRQREQSNAHRRRKPSNSISTSSAKSFHLISIAKSTVSIEREETLSCTDLSLNSSAYRSCSGDEFFTNHTPKKKTQQFECVTGCDEKVSNGGYGRSCFHHAPPMVLVPRTDHSGYSDSNSEASANESVVNKKGNAFMLDDADHDMEKISLPFIDFLGVRAT